MSFFKNQDGVTSIETIMVMMFLCAIALLCLFILASAGGGVIKDIEKEILLSAIALTVV